MQNIINKSKNYAYTKILLKYYLLLLLYYDDYYYDKETIKLKRIY